MKKKPALYVRVRQILESARSTVARSVNTTQVVSNWLVGREIVEEEQKGKARADYGERLIRKLSAQLQVEYGSGYSLANIKYFRKFYLEYSQLAGNAKGYTVRGFLPGAPESLILGKGYAVRSQSDSDRGERVGDKPGPILHVAGSRGQGIYAQTIAAQARCPRQSPPRFRFGAFPRRLVAAPPPAAVTTTPSAIPATAAACAAAAIISRLHSDPGRPR